ncbi:IS6 family transposase [Azospirillum rugosum]|uniref:Transposase-like protein n=1 Tax=Azospirillum rugosum TaxID=416170 RepID=A0ABS4SXZ2_9PROT|nr:IS6 family transposase [Azospirillum rugosum]MBP2297139.1 transposase-like protein [Azospirillum rugosum]MDQ0530955.1 transposase-like protein [Azospirillum rugosum]
MLNRLQLPSDVVFLIVLWRLRFKLSLRDLAKILLLRGLVFSHEAVRDWETKLIPLLIDALRQRRRGKIGRSWYVDETYLKVSGRWHYLYRAIDSDGHLIDVYLSETRSQAAAEAFFRSAVAVTGITPERVTSDKHASYPPALQEVFGDEVEHRTSKSRTIIWSRVIAESKAALARCAASKPTPVLTASAGRTMRCATSCGRRPSASRTSQRRGDGRSMSRGSPPCAI